jgi:hypothetical protein
MRGFKLRHARFQAAPAASFVEMATPAKTASEDVRARMIHLR